MKNLFIMMCIVQNSYHVQASDELPEATLVTVAIPTNDEELGTQEVNAISLEINDEYNSTPLMLAIMSDFDIPIIINLIGNSPDINFQDDFGKTALHYAARKAADRDIDPIVVIQLLEHGADRNIKDIFGKTPSEYAHTETEVYKILAPWKYYFTKKFNDTFSGL
ncbi:ankyrin repeat domain-containing protein [Candidatus Babeliales bacterium]|nr:ankyrin repeat domain-containing protein [Candidatus Babeliales bacterium]MBP9843749.1 ankyrin repeat domain-containing protein [Candidatus Babeliales bacterium]